MQVSSVLSVTTPGAAGKQVGQLGKDDFLKLLMTQLRNQDPLKPMEDTQFIAQMAQFTTLERMQEMSDRMGVLLQVEQLGQANGLIGKSVNAMTSTSPDIVQGVVDSVKVVDGEAVLLVAGEQVKLAEIVSVADEENWQLVRASSLIGKEVGTLDDRTGKMTLGAVESVKIVDGSVVLVQDGKEVKFSQVVSAAEGAGTQLGQASSLLGKEAVARTDTSGGRVEGIVESLKIVDGKLELSVNGRSVKLEDVISLTKTEP